MKPLTLRGRLKLLLFMKALVGSITTVFLDPIVGIIILISGAITLVWIEKLTHATDREKEKSVAHLHMIIGLLMFLGVLVIVVTGESHKDGRVLIKTTIGCLLILKGTYELYKIKNDY